MNTYLFWFIQLTWGILINIPGTILACILLCSGKRPKRYRQAIYFEAGENWGGVNFGGFFFIQKNGSDRLKSHEYGHCFQNLYLGPLMPFAVSIPSAVRYHYRARKIKKGYSLKPYDAFWCESWATSLGQKHNLK
ncbi:hypothetical protein JMA_14400 [Jeotgalibacillus malaysiensis]|uniref:Uncharacterized protein n=1 Tax=Jeotgalibacillus malaysiensis TaxID=1508404 RepID=A0A0B5AQ14_9BACL|nr:hypothetical protein [Jeotgalibacillus malaysiensis]AJD90757.1 hypothetical protein JMA_14400 [Jeotgalibacillus malaysiensis]